LCTGADHLPLPAITSNQAAKNNQSLLPSCSLIRYQNNKYWRNLDPAAKKYHQTTEIPVKLLFATPRQKYNIMF